MGLELVQGYNKEKRETAASGDYLLNRTDLMMDKLNNIEHELEQLQSEIDENAKSIDSYQEQVDTMKYQLAERMNAVTKVACHYTSDLVKDLDSSMDMLASQRSVKSLHKLLTATCVISIFNMASIVVILLYIFKVL